MGIRLLAALAALLLAATAWAAPPPNAVLMDLSTTSLIEPAAARDVLAENIPARLWKAYPATKWGFVSQVEGGLTAGGICVVTARVMVVPVAQTSRTLLLRPYKVATAFDAATGGTPEQCRVIAKTKLGEAAQGVVSSLVR